MSTPLSYSARTVSSRRTVPEWPPIGRVVWRVREGGAGKLDALEIWATNEGDDSALSPGPVFRNDPRAEESMRTGVERDARCGGVVVSPLQFTTRPGTTSAPSSHPAYA